MNGWRFLFLSLALHLLLNLGVGHLPNFQVPNANEQPIEIEVVSIPGGKYVLPRDMNKDDKALKLKPKEPTILGTEDRFVVDETVAGGKTSLGSLIPKLKIKVPQENPGDTAQVEQAHLPEAEDGMRLRERESGHLNSDYSPQAEEHLPGVKEGKITSLNSERFVYASFFNRLDQQILPLWQRNVRESLNDSALKNYGDKEWVTIMEVVIDIDGHVKSLNLLKPSGVPQFDEAVRDTFKSANFFPNPPRAMAKEDGFIHLIYGFTVLLRKRFLAGF